MYPELLERLFDVHLYKGPEMVIAQTREFQNLREGETLRMVSGELNYDAFVEWCDDLTVAHQDKQVDIKMIAGPVVEIKHGTNPVFDLIRKGIVRLYIPRTRMRHHYRIFGERKVWAESYHGSLLPLEERAGYFVEEPIRVAEYLYNFEDDIATYRFPICTDPEEELITLPTETIRALKETTDRRGYCWDYLLQSDFRKLLAEIDHSNGHVS